MSVLCTSSAGWLLDELLLLNKWYQQEGWLWSGTTSPCHQENKQGSPGTFYRFKKDLFMIQKPHIATPKQPPPQTSDALHHPRSSDLLEPSNSITISKKAVRKKRKRSTSLNAGELDALLYHKKISDLILEGSLPLIHEGLTKRFLQPLSEEQDEKSEVVSEQYTNTCRLAQLCDMAKQMPMLSMSEHGVHVLCNGNPSTQDTDFLSHITENNSDLPQIIRILGEQYLIPPKSSFLLSDITCLEPLLHYKTYNAIVIDPPWENKSVKRSKSYSYLSPMEMKQLPIPALADTGCLIVTWVTNRQKHLRFVKEELYPHWSVKTLAEWHWVKITRSGEFVYPFDSDHKKPYEIMVLGRLHGKDNSTPRNSELGLSPIPQHKLIISVPCKLHSRKPPLSEILKEYIEPDAKCLELFARNLQPRWTSWGNEVLKFQHMDYFIPLETQS
ncbi:N(6)-adenine-specific methyltransferase METTL4 [Pelodytes ibericus]